MAKINIRKFIERLRFSCKSKQQNVESHRIHAYELEPRVLYSAAPIPVEMAEGIEAAEFAGNPLDGAFDLDMADDLNQAFTVFETEDDPMTGLSESFGVEQTAANEFVFVDSSVEEFDWLTQQIQEEFPEATVVVLDSQLNGIEQITDALSGAQHVSAIHFVSHGSDGNVQLGNTALNSESLELFTDQIVQWSHSLTLEADLYFYGCNLAASETGVELLESLEAITGADLAASDDLTGHESLGGDWDLEYRSGDINESDLFFSRLQENWNSVLGTDLQPDGFSVSENNSVSGNVLENDGTGGHFLSAAPVISYDANQDTDASDGFWIEQNGSGGNLQHDGSVTHTFDTTNAPNSVYGAYEFSGGAAEFSGVPAFFDASATFELWFNPSDGSGQEVLFDIGNLEGTTLKLNDNQLEFHSSDVEFFGLSIGIETLTTTVDLSAQIASDEYIHFVGVLDDTGLGMSMSLYINGQLVDSDSNTNFNEWANPTVDGIGLGGPAGAITVTASAGNEDYVGEIAEFNIYDRVLDATQIETNYESAFLDVVSHDAVSSQGVSISIDSAGNFTYDAGSNFEHLEQGESIVDTFDYQARDFFGNQSVQTVSITVTGENDGPESLNSGNSITGTEDFAPLVFDLRTDVTDPEGDPLSIVNFTHLAGNEVGVFVSADGNFLTVDVGQYSFLDDGEVEQLQYNYQVDDGNGGILDRTVRINIEGVNDAPEFTANVIETLSEDAGTRTVNLLNGFSDDESHTFSVDTIELLSGNDVGLSFSGNALTIDANAYNRLSVGETETITYRYTVTDGVGVSSFRHISFVVTGENDLPFVTNPVVATFEEGSGVVIVDLLQHSGDPDASEVLSVVGATQTSGDLSATSLVGDILSINTDLLGSLNSGDEHVITFTYRVTDDFGQTVDQTATITIEGVGTAPTVGAVVTAAANETDSAFFVDLLAGATDVEGDELSVQNLSVVGGDASGIAFFPANGELNVDPSAYSSLRDGESETIRFGYDVVDATGESVAQTAEITISGVDLGGPTVLAPLLVVSNEDLPVMNSDLLLGATDPDGGVLTTGPLTLVSGDGSGISKVGDTIQLNPSAYDDLSVGETETVTYTYDIFDDDGNPFSQTIRIDIEGRNDAPQVTGNITRNLSENGLQVVLPLLTGASDPDRLDSLSVTGVTHVSGNAAGVGAVSGGAVSVNTTAYEYLAQDEVETIVYDFFVDDGNGGQTPRTLTIHITGQNDAPTVIGTVVQVWNEDDGAVSQNLLAGASDVDVADTLHVANLVLQSGDGSGVVFDSTTNFISVDTSFYSFLAEGESEVINYEFDVVDSQGAVARQRATFTIEGRNDAPVVNSAISAMATEDESEFMVDLLDHASDVDASDVLSVVNLAVTGDAVGVRVNPDNNTLSVDPSFYNHLGVGETETIVFSYNVSDGSGAGPTQTATIEISGVNDAPLVGSSVVQSLTQSDSLQSISLLEHSSDPDSSDSLVVSNLTLVSGDDSGVAFNVDRLDVDPSAYEYLADGEVVTLVYSYEVDDSNGGTVNQTATIEISGENDTPVVTSAVTEVRSQDDALFAVDLLAGAMDIDASDSLRVDNLVLLSGDESGVVVNADNTLSVNPAVYNDLAVGQSAVIVYQYDVSDDFGATVTQTAMITINGANDAPTVSQAIFESASEDDIAFTVDLLENASDQDASDSLSVANLVVASGDAVGVTVNADNTLSVDPGLYNHLAVGEVETIKFEYEVIDALGDSAIQTATIEITGENDAPQVSSTVDFSLMESDSLQSISLLAHSSDSDVSDSLSVSNLMLTSGDDSGVTVNGNSLDIDPLAYEYLADGEVMTLVYSYEVADNHGAAVRQTATIEVTGENDNPVVSGAVVNVRTEDDASFSVDLLDGAMDIDINDTLSTDNLVLISGNSVGVVVNADDTLSVDPSLYSHLAVGEIETIVYEYEVVDSAGGSLIQTATIEITGENDAPQVGSAVHQTLTESDSLQSISLLTHSSDPDASDLLSVTGLVLVAGDDSGVTVNGDRLDVDPSAYEYLADGEVNELVYEFEVVDGNGGTVKQTATIEITGENDTPVVSSAVAEVVSEDDLEFKVDLLAGASDIDAMDILNTSKIELLSGDAVGVTVNADNTLSVRPSAYNHLAEGQTETVVYQYEISDDHGALVTQTATITINGANDAPTVAAGVTESVNEDDSVTTVDLLAGASDADLTDSINVQGVTFATGDPAGISVVGNTLEVDPSAYNYLADGDVLTVTYDYDIVDDLGASVRQTATIEITGSNDEPVVSTPVVVSATEDEPGFIVDLVAGATDADAGAILSVDSLILVSGDDSGANVTGAAIEVDPSAYNHLAAGESEVLVYEYSVVDEHGASVTQAAVVTITGENDGPTVSDNIVSLRVVEDTAIRTLDLLENASDVDASDTLSVQNLVLETGDPVGIRISGTKLEVDPSAYQYLADGEIMRVRFSYDIADGQGETISQNAVVRIVGANDAPQVLAKIDATFSEDDAPLTVDLLPGVIDVDATDTLNVQNLKLVNGDDSGVILVGNKLEIDPAAYQWLSQGEVHTIEYEFEVVDSFGGTVVQNAFLDVVGANDGPVVTANVTETVTEDSGSLNVNLLDNATDIDRLDTLSVSNISLLAGDFSGVEVVGDSIIVDSNVYDSLAVGQTEKLTFSYDVSDGQGGSVTGNILSVEIVGVNDDPTVAKMLEFVTSEDTTLVVDLLQGASDIDSSTLDIVLGDVVSGDFSGITVSGTELVVDSGSYQSLQSGEVEELVANYFVVDADGGRVSQTLSIQIEGNNDAPEVVLPVDLSVDEDSSRRVIDLMQVFGDIDNTGLSFNVESVGIPDLVDVEIRNNELIVRFNENQFGDTDIVVSAKDAGGLATSTNVNVEVQPVNDAPVVVDQAIALSDSTGVNGNVLDKAFDVDSSTVTAALKTAPTNGTVTINPDGTFKFVPDAGFSGTDSFEFIATDGQSISQTGEVVLSVVGSLNQNPTNTETIAETAPEAEEVVVEDVVTEGEAEAAIGQINSNTSDDTVADVPPTTAAVPADIVSVASDDAIGFEGRAERENLFTQLAANSFNNTIFVRPVVSGLELPEITFSSLTTKTAAIVPEAAVQIVTSLNTLGEDLDHATEAVHLSLNMSVVSLSGVSIGVVTWALRSSVLLAAMMTNLPAWRAVDPLSVLGYVGDDVDDGESLMDIVDGTGD